MFKGAAFSLATCSNGTLIPTSPRRVGRVDATQAGPSGVPEAFTVRNLITVPGMESMLIGSRVGHQHNPDSFFKGEV